MYMSLHPNVSVQVRTLEIESEIPSDQGQGRDQGQEVPEIQQSADCNRLTACLAGA